ncbi:hypothetical protein [Levilactobacillus lindianensis]|uniref:hypothetical protein n=1 Tax=Levilactobacillus lindianensis TaxID=2486018 RepID=UPI000F73E618|nr:hypothetical protein [Levilactobacillus lindianensis]
MANTKNSQAAKIRQQIISWLQDPAETEVVSQEKFPGIRGIRAVSLRQKLGDLGYVNSVVMGAVSAAPSIDTRIKKAARKPRQVFYYFDGEPDTTPAPTKPVVKATTSQPKLASTPATPQAVSPAVEGLSGTSAFQDLLATNQALHNQVNALLDAAQQQRPLGDLELTFLTEFTAQVAKQTELLDALATQERIDQLRH